jgi:predicted RNA-binding Zn-ribbon protein involved in translation (DUF1610 family)
MKLALTKFACLSCQRVLKRPADATQKICPRCGGITYRTGSDFKAPRAGDRRGWQVASFLVLHGFPYYRIGLAYPRDMNAARLFVKEHADKAVDISPRSVSVHWLRSSPV